jgi:hypothetical protein
VRIARSLETPRLFSHCIFSDRQGLKKEPRHHGGTTAKRSIGEGNLKGLSMHLEVRELLKGKGRSFVLMLVLLAVLALVGCGNTETKVSADKVVQDALAAQAEASSYRMVVTLDASAQGTMSGSAMNATLSGNIDCLFDQANKKMKAEAEADIDVTGEQPMAFDAEAEVYVVDNYTYMQAAVMGMSQGWTKQALPDDFWQSLASDNFQTALLTSVEAEYLKEEKVGGVTCYVLDLTPDVSQLQQMLQQMVSGGASTQGADSEIPNLESFVKSMSFKVWIAKDTSLLTQVKVELNLSITPEALGEPANGENLTITLNLTMNASDFNQSVSIQLPDEAKNADEGEGFELPF